MVINRQAEDLELNSGLMREQQVPSPPGSPEPGPCFGKGIPFVLLSTVWFCVGDGTPSLEQTVAVLT